MYDPVSKRVFTFNGRSKNATAIDAANGTVVSNIPLDGKPEFAVADGKGMVYVNIEEQGRGGGHRCPQSHSREHLADGRL